MDRRFLCMGLLAIASMAMLSADLGAAGLTAANATLASFGCSPGVFSGSVTTYDNSSVNNTTDGDLGQATQAQEQGGPLSACQYPALSLPGGTTQGTQYYAAMEQDLFTGFDLCGACCLITNPANGKTVTVVVTDECPVAGNAPCANGNNHIDLSYHAISQINGGGSNYSFNVNWQVVPCPLSYFTTTNSSGTTNITYSFKGGASSGWAAIILRDYEMPIQKVSFCNGNGTGCSAATWNTSYNGWVPSGGPWTTFYLQITDDGGNVGNFGPISCCSPTSSSSTGPVNTDAVSIWGNLGGQMSACGASTPTFTVAPSPSRTASPTVTHTPSPSPSPSGTRSASPTSSASPSATSTSTKQSSPTFSPSPSATSTDTSASTLTGSPSASPSATGSDTRTASATATPSSSPSSTPTVSATATASATFSAGPTLSSSMTKTGSPSPSGTASASPSFTATRSATPSPSPSGSPSVTGSFSPSPAFSATSTPTVTASPTLSPVFSATATPTATPSRTQSPMFSATATPTATPSVTPSTVVSATSTPTATPSVSPSTVVSDTATPTASASMTPSGSASETPRPTATATPTLSPAPGQATLLSVGPASAAEAGGTLLTVTGTGFQAGAVVLWNGVALGTTFISSTQLQASSPAAADGSYTVTVENPGGQAASGSGSVTVAKVTPVPLWGPLVIDDTLAWPDPLVPGIQGWVSFKLEGPADQVTLRIYTPAMVCVGSAQSGASLPGWGRLAMPAATTALHSGLYYYEVRAQRGESMSRPAIGRMVILQP